MTALAWTLIAYLVFNAFILAYVSITEAETPSRRELAVTLPVTALLSGVIALAGLAYRGVGWLKVMYWMLDQRRAIRRGERALAKLLPKYGPERFLDQIVPTWEEPGRRRGYARWRAWVAGVKERLEDQRAQRSQA